ncbi:MAG: YbbR-like domain-containing protein, partial [Gemmatimonadetes bacterium]|nr:YbbR-like domain-containing protein [Gemmatimonadota bacterium]
IKVLPVAQGAPAEGFVVFQEPRVDPERVSAIGARSIVERIEALGTLPIDLTGLREDRTEVVRVDLTEWDGIVTDPIEVEVFYDLEKIEDRTLAKRPIRISPRSGTQLLPDSLDLVVRGPAARLGEIPESRIRLSLNVEPIDSPGEFSYLAEVMEGNRIRFYRQLSDGVTEEVALPDLEGAVQNLPDQVVVVDFSPKVFRIVRGGN